MILIAVVAEIRFVKWDQIEEAEQVTNMLSMHTFISGTCIVLCLAWKVLIPLVKYFCEEKHFQNESQSGQGINE